MTYPYVNDNGKRRANHKEWDEIRAELSQLKVKLQLTDDEFRLLSPYDNWREIQNNIYKNFCKITHYNKLPIIWQSFKNEFYFIDKLADPYEHLNGLIDDNEKIWFIVSYAYDSKLWFYEGKMSVIQKVLDEISFYPTECYFVSKKYQWLIVINHAYTLIGTGDMVEPLKNLSKNLNGDL
ncbi:DUF6756 family protein [Moraxella oblonga]|uniref:DUF6756 family protein n=1 Tax=Moraxella oblonga TaxID=200413 RepID=UPI0008351C96|nr:DUF6756 family protein [Moraxella oblonga]